MPFCPPLHSFAGIYTVWSNARQQAGFGELCHSVWPWFATSLSVCLISVCVFVCVHLYVQSVFVCFHTLFMRMSVYLYVCWYILCVSFVGLYVIICRPDSAEGFSSCPSAGSRNGEKDWENDSTTSSTPSNTEYTGIRDAVDSTHGHLHSYCNELTIWCLCCAFFLQDPNYTKSQVPNPTSTSSRMPSLTAAWLARSMKGRKTRYLMYVLFLCVCEYVFLHLLNSLHSTRIGFLQLFSAGNGEIWIQ